MAFASTISQRPRAVGNERMSRGTFTNGASDAGGDINTGLRKCEHISLQHTGSAVAADAPAVNETLPCAGSAVTIVTTAGADGIWQAWGY